MNQEQRHFLEEKIARGYLLHSAECLAEGMRLYQGNTGGFIALAFLPPLLSNVLALIPGLGVGAVPLTSLVISPLIYAGFYTGAQHLAQGERPRFGDLFRLRGRGGALIANNLLYVLILSLVLLPTYFVLEQAGYFAWWVEAVRNNIDPPAPPALNEQAALVLLLNLLPLLYLLVGYCLTYPLILFFHCGAWSALEYSRRLVTRRWGTFFFLLMTFFAMGILLSTLVPMLLRFGTVIANIGSMLLFLLVPWYHLSLYAAFNRVIAGEAGED